MSFKAAKEKRREEEAREAESSSKQQKLKEEREKALRTVERRRGSLTIGGGLHCFKETSAKLYIHLPPSFLSDVPRGIDTQLNRYLLKYDDNLGGVIISYSDVEILQRCGRVLYDNPFIHFYVAVKFLVFAPTVGGFLVGTVNKVGQGHIGLLVFGVFNASISFEYAKNYQVNSQGTGWEHKVTKEVLEIGSDVSFVVKGLETINDIFTIFGSLEGPPCGLATNFKGLAGEKPPVPKTPLVQQVTEPPKVSPAKKKDSISEPASTKKRKNDEINPPEEISKESSSKKRKLENGHETPSKSKKKKTEDETGESKAAEVEEQPAKTPKAEKLKDKEKEKTLKTEKKSKSKDKEEDTTKTPKSEKKDKEKEKDSKKTPKSEKKEKREKDKDSSSDGKAKTPKSEKKSEPRKDH